MKNWLVRGLGFILLFSLLVGCAAPAAPVITLEGAYGRLSPSTPGAGAFYVTLKNSGNAPEKLLSAKCSACGMVEVHEMVKKADGTMGMNLVDKPVEIPAGGQTELKVGGLHIMCMKINADQFKVGSKLDLTLVLEKSGEKTVSAEIRAE